MIQKICSFNYGKKGETMDKQNELKHFKFWCQKVLPLVYDDSLSYYEVLCKVVEYINKIIDDENGTLAQIKELRNELEIVKQWIANFNTKYAEEIIKDYLATMIFIEITESGYFVYYIPERWEDIKFETTGLDVDIPNTEYGRLVLSYQ